MANTQQDKSKISKQWRELSHAAKVVKAKEWEVLKYMQENNTNDRSEIYRHFGKNI